MAAYDEHGMYEQGPPVTREWLRDNNAIAARIPRGRSTPATRLELAAQEYERAAAVALKGPGLAYDSGFSLADVLGVADQRTPPALDSSDGAVATRKDVNRWGRWAQAAYGAGRAYERAIQEARFGRMYGNAECLQQSGAWLEANR